MQSKKVRIRSVRAWVLAAAVAIVALGGLAGCGSGSDSTSTGGSTGNGGADTGESASKAPSGSPIVVATMAPVKTQIADYGGIGSSLEASAMAINEEGGINGHPIEVFSCNTKQLPANELGCAREAVEKGAVAMVGMSNFFVGEPVEEVLEAGNVIDLANTGPLVGNGPNSYPITWEPGGFAACVAPEWVKREGIKSVVLIEGSLGSVTGQIELLIEAGAKAAGIEALPPIETPAVVSDYAPYVAQAQKSGADLVMILEPAGGPQALIKASSAANADYKLCTSVGLVGGGLEDLGAAEENLYVGSTFKPLGEESTPLMEEFIEQVEAQAATGDSYAVATPTGLEPSAMISWLGMQALQQIAGKIEGEITPEAVYDAIKTAKVKMGGIIPDLDFSKVKTGGPYERLFSSTTYLWKWESESGSYSLEAETPETLSLLFGGSAG